jgi:hypothetical protein
MSMTRADLGFSLVLVALGIAIAVESWRMPRLTELGVNPWSAPGIAPGLLGGVILVLGLVLLTRSLARLRSGAEAEPSAFGDLSLANIVATLVLTIGYAGFLVGNLPFWLATFLFVLLFLWWFDRPGARKGAYRVVHILTAPLLAAVTAAAVTFLFRDIFLVRLP